MSEPNGGRFDLASLAKKSEPTTITPTATASGEGNPFLDLVEKSYAEDEKTRNSGWREVSVPRSMLDELITTMRALSTYFGKVGKPIGVHLRVQYQTPDSEEWVEVGPSGFDDIDRDDNRDVFFKYTGRKRMNRNRRAQAQQPAAGLAQAPTDADDREDAESELQPA